jgi:putative hydrolase of the HAD superfamily
MSIKAILFDLYGTLVIRQERQFLRELSKYYLPPSDDAAALSKLGALGLKLINTLMVTDLSTHELPQEVLALFPHMSRETASELKQHFRQSLEMEALSTRLIPGVKTILAFFRQRGYKLGVISNASTMHKQPLFDFDLARFLDVSVFSCDIGYAKPAPEIYLNACQRLDVTPREVLFVGDSYNMDVKTPCELGMQAIHVSKSPRHQHRIAQITDMGLLLLEPRISHIYNHLNALSMFQEQQIVVHQIRLFPHHPDRQWLTYLCTGTRNGQHQDFLLQRAILVSSSPRIPQKTHPRDVWVEIDEETLRLSSCL